MEVLNAEDPRREAVYLNERDLLLRVFRVSSSSQRD